jgi:hypothetical protein
MEITLDMLPIELRQLIEKAMTGNTGMRSPITKPLTDLREPSDPKKRLHRPSFFFETGPDLPPYVHQEYPKVKWHQHQTDSLGRQVDIYVPNAAAEAALGPEWMDRPSGTPLAAIDQVQQEMMLLTDEERQMVVDAHRDARVKSVQAKMAKLSDAELSSVLPNTPKRGPGRPKKADGDGS